MRPLGILATRDGLRYTRLGWTLGYYVGQFRCRAFGHKWKRYWTDASLYSDTVRGSGHASTKRT